MTNFKNNYQADIKRYNGNADTYIRIWLYLYRKCCYCKTPILKILYKVAFIVTLTDFTSQIIC